jgi:hypothetical protein
MRRKRKMARLLLKTTDIWHVDTEEEAIGMIEEAKNKQAEGCYSLTKSGYVVKTKKAKGEIVDMWFVVTTEKTFSE